MRISVVTVVGALLILMAGTPPVLAEPAQPIPRGLDEQEGAGRADLGNTKARQVRETAAAAERSCDAGEPAGCAALGRAYLYGEGKPQNRPVAELLLREACDSGEGSGCLALGDLLWSSDDAPVQDIGEQAFARGCELGNLDACDRIAETLETSDGSQEPQPERAAALRRDICARGGTAACRHLAQQQFSLDRTPAEQTEGQAVLERLCRGGDSASCTVLLDPYTHSDDPLTPYLRDLLAVSCRAELSEACQKLGMAVFAEGSGPPEQRADALALFDRACDLDTRYCEASQAIRTRPALTQGCARGVREDCVTMGKIYADPYSPLHSPAEAVTLLGDACEAGAFAACAAASHTLLYGFGPPTEDAASKVLRWSTISCESGVALDCENLGNELLHGSRLPMDRARGLEFYALACELDRTLSCDKLEQIAIDDPEAPLPLADSRILPPLTPEEQLAFDDWRSAARMAEQARNREQDCTSSAVLFRGVMYEDTICTRVKRVTGGFRAKPFEAPWQALIWRPDTLGRVSVGTAQKVHCGGAVIATGWLLTAAHCLIDEDKKAGFRVPIATGGHRVRTGLFNPLGDEGFSYPIKRVIPHPDFDKETYAFDIALVEYDTRSAKRMGPVRETARIRLDPQPLRPVRAGSPAYVYGWGRTAFEGGIIPAELRGARLELLDNAACTALTKYRDHRRDSILCAKGARGEQACSGDSGGALVEYGELGRDKATVIGVVSAGRKCGSTGEASRYIRIAHPRVQVWLNRILPPASRR